MGNGISVTDERAKDVVVVQRPIHNAEVVVSLRGAENALVVVSKSHQINSIPLRVVSIHLAKVKYMLIWLDNNC